MRTIANEASCHSSGLLHKFCGFLHWFYPCNIFLILLLPPWLLRSLILSFSLSVSFWFWFLHGGDGATHLVIHQAICCSHGSREIMNLLPSKFCLSPSWQSGHEIEKLVLLWHVIYIQHQGIEFLDIVSHWSGVSEPFQWFIGHPSTVGGEELFTTTVWPHQSNTYW